MSGARNGASVAVVSLAVPCGVVSVGWVVGTVDVGATDVGAADVGAADVGAVVGGVSCPWGALVVWLCCVV